LYWDELAWIDPHGLSGGWHSNDLYVGLLVLSRFEAVLGAPFLLLCFLTGPFLVLCYLSLASRGRANLFKKSFKKGFLDPRSGSLELMYYRSCWLYRRVQINWSFSELHGDVSGDGMFGVI
jgi:hypothetical protein